MTSLSNKLHDSAACASSLARQPSQTSSKPPTTSLQTPAHSRRSRRRPQSPRASQRSPSSRRSSSRRISATMSRAVRRRRAAVVVVWRDMCSVSERYARAWARSVVVACRAARLSRAGAAGRGIASDTDARSGSSASIVPGSGGATSGESSGNVRLCSCRVWCARCVAKAECAVINLSEIFVLVYIFC